MNVFLFIGLVSVGVGIAAYLSIQSESGFIGYVLGLIVGVITVLAELSQKGVIT